MDKILELIMSEPEMLIPVIKEYIKKYKPMVYDLAQEIVEICKDYSNNTEYPVIVAKTKKNLYDAYINAGFTKDQALAFMLNDNLHLMKNIKETAQTVNKTK